MAPGLGPPPGPPPQSPRLPAPSPSSHRLLCFPPRPDQRARLLRLLVPGHGQLWTVSDHCLPCASERPRPGQRALPQPGPAPRPDAGVARLPARVAGSPGPRCGVRGRSPVLPRDPVRFSSRPHVAPQVGADRSPSTGPGASANSQGGRGGGRSSAQGEWRPRGGRTRGSLPPNFRCSRGYQSDRSRAALRPKLGHLLGDPAASSAAGWGSGLQHEGLGDTALPTTERRM